MNVREEDKPKGSCTGRGFGLAAAAIGVGVGAALYYFFNQEEEHPDTEGSTSERWQAEQPNTLEEESDSYSTISEHSTSDTSVHRSIYTSSLSSSSLEDSDDVESEDDVHADEYSLTESDITELDTSDLVNDTLPSDETATEWDVTHDSSIIPFIEIRSPMLNLFNNFSNAVTSPINRSAEGDRLKQLREQRYRERSWTLEECSICFEVMLSNQEVMKLACSHNFHGQCILPWLQEKQTCPICRKEA